MGRTVTTLFLVEIFAAKIDAYIKAFGHVCCINT